MRQKWHGFRQTKRDNHYITQSRTLRQSPRSAVSYKVRSDPEEAVVAATDVFWKDLAQDLQDPEFLREYIAESNRIATIDYIVNALDAAREELGMSKSELARMIKVQPATIRRLFTAKHPNPTLATISEVAAAVGMRITVEPISDDSPDNRTVQPGQRVSLTEKSSLPAISIKKKSTLYKSDRKARKTHSTTLRGLRSRYSLPNARISA